MVELNPKVFDWERRFFVSPGGLGVAHQQAYQKAQTFL
jgi:hypothetical protein